MLDRFIIMLLMLMAQTAIAMAVAPLGDEGHTNDQRGGLRVAQTATEVTPVTGTITIIYEKPAVECKLPMVNIDGACALPKCQANMTRTDGKCQCPAGTAWNTNRSTCQTIVTEFACPEGSTRVGKACVQCPAQMYLYEGQCTCPEPLVRNGNRCKEEKVVNVPSCPAGMVRFGADCVEDGSAAPPLVADSTLPAPPVADLAYPLQAELKRVGCLSGPVDGEWGPGSRAALGKFAGRAGLRLSREPTMAALNATRSKRAGFCPAPVYKAPRVAKPGRSKPNCSKIRYAYTKGNTCGCSGGRTFNGRNCVRNRHTPTPRNDPSPYDWTDVIKEGVQIYQDSKNSGGGGRGNNECYRECDDCPLICQ